MPHPDHERNRATWNRMVEIHYDHPDYRKKEFLAGLSKLTPIEREALGDVRGKTLLHLQCQFGMDTLSWAREGAIVTGVDISDTSIAYAERLKEESGLKGDFFRSDVLDLIGVIPRKFDIVFQSYGTYMWLCDIRKWAEVVAHYLNPGGTFFIVDEHPINSLFIEPRRSYFHQGPDRDPNAPDYCNRNIRVGEHVEWQHPLSSIINALIDAGLEIQHMGEYNKGYYAQDETWTKAEDGFYYPPSGPLDYPYLFSIKARKK